MFKDTFYLGRGYVDLGEIHSSVGYTIKDLEAKYGNDWKIVGTHIIQRKNSKEAHEKTLSYIKEMLEKGEIKVGGLITRKPGEPEKSLEELKGKSHFFDIIGSPDEIIKYIREKWDNAQEESKRENNPAILSGFESWEVVFTLVENDWPRY